MWIIVSSIYMMLGGFLRRWFGGMFPDEKYKILGNRGVQTFFMLFTFFTIFTIKQSWEIALILSCWMQFVFWSIGHGPGFDYGRGGYPSEKTIERYKKYYLNVIPDWFADRGFYAYYGVGYDFTWMFVRYTVPMVPMALFVNWHYILLGIAVSPIYLFCWMWYESTVWLFTEEWRSKATQVAEIICGALVYGGCYLIEYFS